MSKRAVEPWPQLCFHGKIEDHCETCNQPPPDAPYQEPGPTRIDIKLIPIGPEHSQYAHPCFARVDDERCMATIRYLAVYHDKRGNRKRETYCALDGKAFAKRWGIALPEGS